MEVKARTKGALQSLYLFMHKKNLHNAVRTSLENFSSYDYVDSEADGDDGLRHIEVCPLYALSNLERE